MKKDAYYFSHDSNARNDMKILRLRRSLGLEGYAIFFCLIEMLREQADYKLPMANIPDIAFDLDTSEDKVSVVIKSYGLFSVDEESFFSARLLRSMDDYNAVKLKVVEGGRKGGLKSAQARLQGGVKPPSSIKGKERKGNKKKEKEKMALPFLSEMFQEKWVEWLAFRSEIKKPYKTDSGIQKSLNFLSKFSEPDAITSIDQSIRNEWQGLFEPKDKPTHHSSNGHDSLTPEQQKRTTDPLPEWATDTDRKLYVKSGFLRTKPAPEQE